MTTQVTIKSPAPNDQDVLIKAVCPPTGCVMIERRLRGGEEVTLYLHDGQCLHIYEVAKEPVENAGTQPQPADVAG